MYFLRQVDDFAISYTSENMAQKIISKIDDHMTIKVKSLEVITKFNGVDIHQTRYCTKVNNATYIKSITSDKKCTEKPSHRLPIPMKKASNNNKVTKKSNTARKSITS